MGKLGWLLVAILCIEVLCYYGGKKLKIITKLMTFLSVGLIIAGLVISSSFVNYHNILAILLLASLWWTGLMLVIYFLTGIKDDKTTKPQGLYERNEPTVALVISVYDEDYEVVERSVAAIKNLYYEDKRKLNFYLVDSNDRQDMQDLASDMQMKYIQRSADFLTDCSLFKGDYIVVLTADMVIQNNFLYRTLGYFDDSKIGALQVAYTHYNDYILQYHPLFAFSPNSQKRRDKFGAAVLTGECTIFRQRALRDLALSKPVNELIELTTYLQRSGWQTRYVKESLANGLAPENMPALLKRFRYNMRLNRRGRRVLPWHLTFWQHLLHLEWFSYVTFSWRKTLLWACPIIYFWLNKQAFVHMDHLFIASLFPGCVAVLLSFKLQGYSIREILGQLVYENALTPYVLWDSLLEFVYHPRLNYPAYHNNSNLKFKLNLKYSWIFGLCLAITIVTLYKAISDGIQDYQEMLLCVWLMYTIFMNLATVILYTEMPRYRRAERFISDKTCQVHCQQYILTGKIADWNEIGAKINLELADNYNPAEILREMPGVLQIDNQQLEFKVIWSTPKALGLVFTSVDSDQYAYLIDNTYAQPIENVKPSRYHEISRRDIRFEEMRPVTFKLSQLPERGQLLDISNSGCKLQARSDLQVTKGRYILIQLNKTLWRSGTIRWLNRQADKTILGIEFNTDN